ncbi:5'/3'-nucleotidase SurE [Acidobacteriota bacterium]
MTNDDGYFSEGIKALYHHIKELGEIYIVAPDREQSATSLSLTLHSPLRVKTVRKNIYSVDGTPADCVYLAVQKFLPRKPDLIISGLNHGPNLGQQDISYSGTVAGAIQGTFLEVPSLAISLLADKKGQYFFSESARISRSLAVKILESPLPDGITLNINIPPPPIKGIKVVKLGQKRYNPEIIVKKDPRERFYYWIGTGDPKAIGDNTSDVKIIKEGYITITPLHRDLTDYRMIELPEYKNYFGSISHEIS